MINKITNFVSMAVFPKGNVNVIVLGHQKTGTTVVAALLSKVSGLPYSSDPLYVLDKGLGQTAGSLIKKPEKIAWYCRRYPHLFGKPIIKDPDFIFLYPAIKKIYRNAKFVFIIRDPRDTIRSICNRLGMPGTNRNPSPLIEEMREGNHHWELILSGQLPQQEYADKNSLSCIEKLAHRWNLAAKIYADHADDLILVKYEDFLKDKEGFITNLANDLGLQSTTSIAKYVDVQYQSKGQKDVNLASFFGEVNLTSIERICSKYMKYFGY